jgi:Fe-S-cluster-containing dehydrogenase component
MSPVKPGYESLTRDVDTGSHAPPPRLLFDELLSREMPAQALSPPDFVDRRHFFRLMGASLALAGLTFNGCRRWPVEEIRPHASRPEGVLPGVPQFYATSYEWDGSAVGVLAKSYDGRPIKIEGNKEHPFSLGATDAILQASILELYDPERHRRIVERVPQESGGNAFGEMRAVDRTWADFETVATARFRKLQERRGAGLAFLAPPVSSPTFARLKREIESAMPEARWFQYHSLHRDHEHEGSRLAFQRVLRPQYSLERARVIALFDEDLLGTHPARLRLAREWASGRHSVARRQMSRMFVVEPGYSLTGAVADYRLAVPCSAIGRCLGYVAAKLGAVASATPEMTESWTAWLDRLVGDLLAARGESLVVVGAAQAPEVHRLAHAINHFLGNLEQTIGFTEEPQATPAGEMESIRQLSRLLEGNVLDSLVILGGNPVYDCPADIRLNLASTPSRPLNTIHLTVSENETSQSCQWSLPAAHFLECWGDGRAWDGTWSIQQPLILPLFGGKSPIELLSMVAGKMPSGLSLVRATFDKQFPQAGQKGWEKALHDGLVADSQFPLVKASPATLTSLPDPGPHQDGMEIRFVADYKVHDGRWANNAWLQELPDPMTRLTWDNAALMSLADAEQLGIAHGDKIRLETEDGARSMEIVAFLMPGHAQGCLTLPLGYGRRAGGSIGAGVGFDVGPLRTATGSYCQTNVRVTGTGQHYPLAATQLHHLSPSVADFALRERLGEKSRPGLIVHETTLEEYLRDPHAPHAHSHPVHAAPLFDPPHAFDSPHKWGMVIDLNTCTGCSGCVVACQAENNIPVVGKSNVARSREMHWLRIDRYFKGELTDPDVVHVPLTCAHCENAPCEQVCPVAATVHDTEGLNSMVYNRCIGTRYCANNCPFKVRRFNYLEYHATHPRGPARPWIGIPDQQQASDVSPLVQLMHNPEVTVRMRGVMEKCTYCVQRIVAARIEAKNRHSRGEQDSDLIAEGEVQTACQAVCPTGAIRFGDLNDPGSAVSVARADDRHYEILEELNLRSRTTHLARIRNRQP